MVQDRHAGPGAAQVVVVGGGAGHADPADRRGSEIAHDRQAAGASLRKLAERLNYIGYVETRPGTARFAQTDMRSIVSELTGNGVRGGCQVVSEVKDIWQAIRQFFAHQATSQ